MRFRRVLSSPVSALIKDYTSIPAARAEELGIHFASRDRGKSPVAPNTRGSHGTFRSWGKWEKSSLTALRATGEGGAMAMLAAAVSG